MKKAQASQPFFQPSFGNRPEEIVGRDAEISLFKEALQAPIGSRNRCNLILGQRGMGKTALLLEMADIAQKEGYVVARTTAHEGMPEELVEQVQLNGSQFFKGPKQLSGWNAGALGFSFGLSFTEPAQKQYGFCSKMSLLCDRLNEKNMGVLLLIDEVHTSKEMREVAAAYQELVGDGKNIAICMAGLPGAVSGVLNDKVLTFLNRASKIYLGAISIPAIVGYYQYAFGKMNIPCADEILEQGAQRTKGLPYLMQLIGYYLTVYSRGLSEINKEVLEKAEKSAIQDLDDNVFAPTFAPLSDNDRIFLEAMAECDVPITTAKLKKKLGENGPAIQPYRKRLMDAGIIEAPRKGELVFAVPFFADYVLRVAKGK